MRMNTTLVGQSKVVRPIVVDPVAGFAPPAWWRGDKYASQSGQLARVVLTRRRR